MKRFGINQGEEREGAVTKELICHAEYSKGECIFDVEREVYDDRVEIKLYRVNRSARFARNSKVQSRVLQTRVEFRNIGTEYESPYLNWYNWFFCAKWVLGMTDDRYLCTAVQKGLKTAAIILHFPPHSRQRQRYKRRLEHLPDSCAFSHLETGGFFVYHRGAFDSLFDLEKIRYIYERHGIDDLNWNTINTMSRLDLSCFGDYKTEPFEPYCPLTREQYVVNGLLLGYPVESTIALLNKTIHDFR